MGCGKLVEAGVGASKATPTLFATPWRLSCHHWVGETPSEGEPPDGVASMDTFSSKERRATRSATRASTASVASQKGRPAPGAPAPPQARKREPASTQSPLGACSSVPVALAYEKACASGVGLAQGASRSSVPRCAAAASRQRPEPSASASAVRGASGLRVSAKAEPHGDVKTSPAAALGSVPIPKPELRHQVLDQSACESFATATLFLSAL